MEVLDLTNDIKKPEIKKPVISDSSAGMQLSDKYKVEIDTNLIDPDEEEELDDTAEAGKDKDEPADDWNPAEIADLIVDTIDFVQDKGGAFLHHKTLFTKQQNNDLRNMIVEYGIQSNKTTRTTKPLTYYEKWLLERQKAHEEYKEILPFTDEEKTRLKNAWRRYLKGKNVKIGDGAALAVTMFSVMAPRTIQILANVFDSEKKLMQPDTTYGDVVEAKILGEMSKMMNELKIEEMTPEQMKEAIETLKNKAHEAKKTETAEAS